MSQSTSPIPLTDYPRPPFPAAIYPCWLREFVEAVATQTQTPLDLPGMLGFAVLATALAKKVEITVYDGWREQVNLFLTAALPPANRKTSVFREMTGPVYAYQAELIRAYRADPTGEGDGAQSCAGPPRLVVDDISPERLATLLAQNGGRIAALSAEAELFDIMGGRYSRDPNFGVFLKGHAGDFLQVDRVNREGEMVSKPALTVGLCAQPRVIAGLASKPGFRDRGLLGRFLYSLPKSTVGGRIVGPPAVPAAVRAAYERNLGRLLRLQPDRDEFDEERAHVVSLGPAARERFMAFEAALEPRLGEFGDLDPIADWAGKLAGAIARIACLLHVAEHADRPQPWSIPVAEATVERALQMEPYLIAHAKAAFGLMGADPAVETARRIVRWMDTQELEAASKKEIFDGVRGRIQRVAEIEPALRLLVEHGQLVEEQPQRSGAAGRNPSPIFRRVAA